MDPQHSAQDVLRCDLCDTPVPPMYCDICHIKLCIPCVGVHLSKQPQKHEVVPFEERGSATKCPKQFVFYGEHEEHKGVEIRKILINKKEIIKKDLQEIEKLIYPEYQEAVLNIPVQKVNARKHTQKLTTALKEQGEIFHKEIDTIIRKMLSEIDDMNSKHLAFIHKQEDAINQTIIEIEQTILNLRNLLDTSDVCLVSEYKSRNKEFRELPAQFQVTLPTFTPHVIDREKINQQLGSLSKLSITEKQGDRMEASGAEFSPPGRPLIDDPQILVEINTGNGILSVCCLSDNDLWTSNENIMRLFNLHGKLLKSVQTKSGNTPYDIAVTQSQHLVYTDRNDRSINIVKSAHIQPIIRLRGWRPLHLCSTSSGDLLVSMISDDGKQSKVVRYSASIEKQSIQWDDQGQPLYSSSANTKYLSENRNLDVCVADFAARAVVVVNASGQLRFRYTSTSSTKKKPFKPWDITTDSQSRILTADGNNQCIHILDQHGHFLRYIDNCELQCPAGLCVDSRDNLFVAELYTGKLKKIQYYK